MPWIVEPLRTFRSLTVIDHLSWENLKSCSGTLILQLTRQAIQNLETCLSSSISQTLQTVDHTLILLRTSCMQEEAPELLVDQTLTTTGHFVSRLHCKWSQAYRLFFGIDNFLLDQMDNIQMDNIQMENISNQYN